MKRLVPILSFLLLAGVLRAQDVRLPEQPDNRYVYYSGLESGWWMAVEPGFTVGSVNSSTLLTARASLVTGYRFSQYLRVGVGVAPAFCFAHEAIDNGTLLMPVFAHLRGNFIEDQTRMFSPFWGFDAGYGIGDGLYLSPAIGLRAGLHRHSFVFSLGYMFQQLDGSLPKGMKSDDYHAFLLKLGYEF